MNISQSSQYANKIITEVSKHILGKNEVLTQIMTGFLANGHLLFEDYPGLAKTMICRCFASALGCTFRRIQFTPDLLPQDITGSEIYNQKLKEFEFKPGPLFANIILADEINRATPKTQSALLEAMGEYQVTVGNKTYPLTKDNQPFIVVATQNPIELEGTFSLPEAQLDRFSAKVNIGYPDQQIETLILKERIKRKKKEFDVKTIINAELFYEMQLTVENVFVADEILEYITRIVKHTRDIPQVKVGSSPRGSLDLLSLARASAVVNGRDYVLPEDVKELAPTCLSHRLILDVGSWLGGTSTKQLINKMLRDILAPRKKESDYRG